MTELLPGLAVAALLTAGYALAKTIITRRRRARATRRPPAVLDMCEVCGKPATHELGEVHGIHAEAPWGSTGMVATYCRQHAPPGAVRVA